MIDLAKGMAGPIPLRQMAALPTPHRERPSFLTVWWPGAGLHWP